MTAGKRWGAFGALLAVLALAVAAVGAGVGASKTNAQAPIVIGWAFDSKGNMAPFDGPALAAAKVRVNLINAKGGVMGRPLRIDTCDTNNNNAAKAKSCAASLLGKGANVIFTTCDVDYATPVVQESLKAGKLTIAPCIGTDQMGPKRFGAAGKLAFSFGNVAQDEGSAMAEYAYRKGWRTANLATNTLLVYFKNVVQAFEKRFTQLGGKIAGRESYATGANNVNAAVSRLNARKADVIVTSTAFGELPALVKGIRVAREQDADPQLVGRRRHVLGGREPAGDRLLRGHVRVGVRGRPEQGRAGAREEAEGVHRRFRHRARQPSTASRRRSAAPAARRTAPRWRRRWRSSGRCRPSPGSSASRRSSTASSGASTA